MQPMRTGRQGAQVNQSLRYPSVLSLDLPRGKHRSGRYTLRRPLRGLLPAVLDPADEDRAEVAHHKDDIQRGHADSGSAL